MILVGIGPMTDPNKNGVLFGRSSICMYIGNL